MLVYTIRRIGVDITELILQRIVYPIPHGTLACISISASFFSGQLDEFLGLPKATIHWKDHDALFISKFGYTNPRERAKKKGFGTPYLWIQLFRDYIHGYVVTLLAGPAFFGMPYTMIYRGYSLLMNSAMLFYVASDFFHHLKPMVWYYMAFITKNIVKL